MGGKSKNANRVDLFMWHLKVHSPIFLTHSFTSKKGGFLHKMTNSVTKITLFPYEGISIKTFCGFGHMILNGTLSHFELISNFQLVEHKRIMSLGRK